MPSSLAKCVRLVALLLLGLAGLASGQQYPFLLLPGSPKAAETLFEDSRGRLWIGGQELACFDGTHFFFLRDYGFPAPADSIQVTEDPAGVIWIAASTGVYRFASGRVEQVSRAVATSLIVPRPDVAIATESPIGTNDIPHDVQLVRISLDQGHWKSETVMDLRAPGPVTTDHEGNIWYVRTSTQSNGISIGDLLRWRPGVQIHLRIYGPRGGTPMNSAMTVRDQFGCWWGVAATYDCGAGPKPALVVEGSLNRTFRELPDGRMIFSGNDMLAVGRPGAFQIATRANGLPGVTDAIAGKDGTIWLTAMDGVYRFPSPFRIESWGIRDGVANPPWSVMRHDGEMYAGLAQKIARLSPDRSRWNIAAKLSAPGDVSALLSGPDHSLFASSMGGGVTELMSDGRAIASTAEGMPPKGGMRLAHGRNGEVWFGGTELGTIERKGRLLEFHEHPLMHDPKGNVLSIKYEEHTHKLWACYVGGLVVREESGRWREFTLTDGLRVNDCWSLAPLPNGDLWYAYRGFPGIALIRPSENGGISIRQYDSETIADPRSITMDLDRAGRLWRSTANAIYSADMTEAEQGWWLPLDHSDGFPADDMNSGSVFVDSDGSLWWGADNDLAHYTPPTDLVTPVFAPQVFVSAFSWENQTARLAEAVSNFPHGVHVVAHIGSLQFDRRRSLHLRYRLLPQQIQWRETNVLDLPLGELASGAHTLEVEGRIFTGPWSDISRYSFRVLRPVWLTPAFLSSCLALAVSVGWAAYLFWRRWQTAEAQVLPDLSPWRLALVPDAEKMTGKVLDSRLEVGRLLAAGGFANVMEGYDRLTKERCAIKVFRTEVKDNMWIQRGFDQEVAALQKIRHPNVVSIYAHGRTGSGSPYLVMEFIDGQSLREILADGPLMSLRVAVLLRQLTSALEAIHAASICHRDLKPENVIVRNPGTRVEEAVLIDFSIAIIKDADETLHGLSRAAGTFDYMAPEQAVGYAQPSSDIYSLARVVLEMLTGRPLRDLLPGASLDLPQRVQSLVRSLASGFSEEAVDRFASALEFDPQRRPQSATEFSRPIVRDLESANAQAAF